MSIQRSCRCLTSWILSNAKRMKARITKKMRKRRKCVASSKTNYNHVDAWSQSLQIPISHSRVLILSLLFAKISRDYDLGDVFFERRKLKLLKHKHKLLAKKKKLKKKILLLKILKIFLIFAAVCVAHFLYFKFFPSVVKRFCKNSA